jgi:FkbM family methyltransferase
MLKISCPYRGQPENNDQWVHRLVFPGNRSGFFVELGAANGLHHSSCWLLERIGWRGICVEPSSVFFPLLERNRPKAVCENVCITDKNEDVIFKEDGYRSRVMFAPKHEFDRSSRLMASITLVELLRKHKCPKVIDYLAMDCEGSDGRILRGFPFGEYQILALSMETDHAKEVLVRNEFVKVRNPFNTTCPWEMNYVHASILNQSARFPSNDSGPPLTSCLKPVKDSLKIKVSTWFGPKMM